MTSQRWRIEKASDAVDHAAGADVILHFGSFGRYWAGFCPQRLLAPLAADEDNAAVHDQLDRAAHRVQRLAGHRADLLPLRRAAGPPPGSSDAGAGGGCDPGCVRGPEPK